MNLVFIFVIIPAMVVFIGLIIYMIVENTRASRRTQMYLGKLQNLTRRGY